MKKMTLREIKAEAESRGYIAKIIEGKVFVKIMNMNSRMTWVRYTDFN